MPAPVTAGFMQFMIDQLQINPWDGEVPRYDVLGNPINPDSTVTNPSDWPVVICKLGGDMHRTSTFLSPYHDDGPVVIEIWGTTKQQVQTVLANIEALWAFEANWFRVPLSGGPASNPFYVVQMMLVDWTLRQEENVRLASSQLAFYGHLKYDAIIHGAVAV